MLKTSQYHLGTDIDWSISLLKQIIMTFTNANTCKVQKLLSILSHRATKKLCHFLTPLLYRAAFVSQLSSNAVAEHISI